MHDTNVVETYKHRDVARQLSLDLSTSDKDRRNLEIRIDKPGSLLICREARDGRNSRWTKLVENVVDGSEPRVLLLRNCRRETV